MVKNRRILAVLLMILVVVSILIASANRYYRIEREHCFEELAEYADSLGKGIKQVFQRDQIWMSRLAQLSAQHNMSPAYQQAFLSYIDGMGQFLRMEMIQPDGRALLSSGELVESGLDFEAIAASGAGISRRMTDPMDPERQILRVYTPVEAGGEVQAILCGVVDLAVLPAFFETDRFEGRAEIYLMESETGNFLLDTLHNAPGSRDEVTGRRPQGNYRAEKIREDFLDAREGTAIYYSETSGEYLYTYYAPTGVADWTILVTVPESVAFREAEEMMISLYIIGFVLNLVFAGFFIWVLVDVRREQRRNDRQLRNIQYLLEVEQELVDAHVHPARFCVALQKIADFTGGETAFFNAVTPRAASHGRLWLSRELPGLTQDMDLRGRFPGLYQHLVDQGSFLSYDLAPIAEAHPADGEALRQLGTHSLMMVPVKNRNGAMIGVLGVCNLAQKWESVEPLSQVCLSFSLTINHFEIHQALTRMGKTDALTGMNNRNCYHQNLEQLGSERLDSFACVYIDVNGLHEINNHLGHDAGDKMLKTVAEAMTASFGRERSFRLGGDEFVVLCKNIPEEQIRAWAVQTRQTVEKAGYALSMGMAHRSGAFDLYQVISTAEAAMQEDKKQFYANSGGERQMRELNKHLDQTLTEKQDMDAFLHFLAPNFIGVYFADLERDTVRAIFIPTYIQAMLEEAGNRFGPSLAMYITRMVHPAWQEAFFQFADFTRLREALKSGPQELTYERSDGGWVHLVVAPLGQKNENSADSLWIFTETDPR